MESNNYTESHQVVEVETKRAARKAAMVRSMIDSMREPSTFPDRTDGGWDISGEFHYPEYPSFVVDL